MNNQPISSQSILDGFQGVNAGQMAGQNLYRMSAPPQQTNPFDDAKMMNFLSSINKPQQEQETLKQVSELLKKIQQMQQK